ncbi:uncharacterized protein LOC108739345 isoform X2 [Agrilus planipennis]|uniref:Uncharacterized protein LOC108739345 isoform X2 n=1 Tax=Agrilus planipennis TaxID=224129 RepID=A0A1W4WXU8_AGRPL|nr:uncharacterized protein LOC108739345 isoform X2 [Agrilus planipennis]
MSSDLVDVCIRNNLSPFIINAIAETFQSDSNINEKVVDNKSDSNINEKVVDNKSDSNINEKVVDNKSSVNEITSQVNIQSNDVKLERLCNKSISNVIDCPLSKEFCFLDNPFKLREQNVPQSHCDKANEDEVYFVDPQKYFVEKNKSTYSIKSQRGNMMFLSVTENDDGTEKIHNLDSNECSICMQNNYAYSGRDKKKNEEKLLLQTVLNPSKDGSFRACARLKNYDFKSDDNITLRTDFVRNISTTLLTSKQSNDSCVNHSIFDVNVSKSKPCIVSEVVDLNFSEDEKSVSFEKEKEMYPTFIISEMNKNDEKKYQGTTTVINTDFHSDEEEEKSMVKTHRMKWSRSLPVTKQTDRPDNDSDDTPIIIDDSVSNCMVLNNDNSRVPVKITPAYSQPYLFYNSETVLDNRPYSNNMDKYNDDTFSENDETKSMSESDAATRSFSITQEARSSSEGSKTFKKVRQSQTSLDCKSVSFESNHDQERNKQELLADVCAMLSSVCEYLDANEWINNSSKDSYCEVATTKNEIYPESSLFTNYESNVNKGKLAADFTFNKDSKRTSENATEFDYTSIKKPFMGTNHQLITFSKDSISTDTIISSAWKDSSVSSYCSKNIQLGNLRKSSTNLEERCCYINKEMLNKVTSESVNLSGALTDSEADISLKWEEPHIEVIAKVETPIIKNDVKNKCDHQILGPFTDCGVIRSSGLEEECQTTQNFINNNKNSSVTSLEKSDALQKSVATNLVTDRVDIRITKSSGEFKDTVLENIDLFDDENGKSMTSNITTINLNNNSSKENIFSSSLDSENNSYQIINKNTENNQSKILRNFIFPTDDVKKETKFEDHGPIIIDDIRDIYMKCARESSRYGLFEELEAYAIKAYESNVKSSKTLNSSKGVIDTGIVNISNSNITHSFTTKQANEKNLEDSDNALRIPFKTDSSFQIDLCEQNNNEKSTQDIEQKENFENPSEEIKSCNDSLDTYTTNVRSNTSKDVIKKIAVVTTRDVVSSNIEEKKLKNENENYLSLNLSKCNLSLNIVKTSNKKYGDIEITHSSQKVSDSKNEYDKQIVNNNVIDNSSSKQVFLIHKRLDLEKNKCEQSNHLLSCFQSAIKVLIEHPTSEEIPYDISNKFKDDKKILPQAEGELYTSCAHENIFKRCINEPINISMRNGCYSSYVYEIFDIISHLSERGAANLDNFQYKRNGFEAFRVAFWNVHELTLEKVRNLGVLEVVCSTILENGWSIVVFQGICHPLALSILCNELNAPRLPRTCNFKGINSKCWRFCVDDSINSDMGFIYNMESGGIGIGVIRQIYRTCGGCESSICTFAVGPTDFTVINTRFVSNAIINFETRMTELLKDRDEPVLVTGDLENFIGKELNGLNCIAGLTPVVPPSLNTCSNNSKGILQYNDSILVNSSIHAGHFTGSWGMVKNGLSHLCIPDGWEWGGSVSSHCPVWGELYVLHNNDAKKISHTSSHCKIMSRYGYT